MDDRLLIIKSQVLISLFVYAVVNNEPDTQWIKISKHIWLCNEKVFHFEYLAQDVLKSITKFKSDAA